MDADTDDITSDGLGNCLTRDGQGQPTANLPMATFRHTDVGDGQAVNDYSSLGQAQNGLLNWTIASGSSDAITATYTPAITELSDGQILHFRATAANLTTTPTFNPNGLGNTTITKNGGQALAIGDIIANGNTALRYWESNTTFELLNPPSVPIGGMVDYFGGSVPSGFALPQGQNLSASTYPAANAVLGTTYGNPGGGDFTMPDVRGRVTAGLDAGGSGRITVAGGNFDGTVLGNAGGAQNQSITIAQGNLPSVNFTVSGISLSDPTHDHSIPTTSSSGGSNGQPIAGQNLGQTASTSNASTGISVSSNGSAASGGSGTALVPAIVQPTMVINKMMRIA
jgi:microcystin-dependent protein